MRLVVLAYQDIGYVCLDALLRARADVRLVLTHEDDPGEEVWFRSVAGLAREAGLTVWTPDDPNAQGVLRRVAAVDPDFIFSFYYRQMLSDDFLALARRGAYNLHGSLLPKYRGRAPVNWALVNGESETGVTLHRMVRRPDAGDIAAQKAVPIRETDTVRDLYAKMTEAAAELMAETWPLLAAGKIVETPQDDGLASYFGGRRPEDGRIDWNLPAQSIYNLCRAVTHPYPGAFTFYKGRKLFVWAAAYDPGVCPEEPGRVLAPAGPDGLPVAAGQGRVIVKTAAWENEDELTGPDLAGLGLPAGTRFDSLSPDYS